MFRKGCCSLLFFRVPGFAKGFALSAVDGHDFFLFWVGVDSGGSCVLRVCQACLSVRTTNRHPAAAGHTALCSAVDSDSVARQTSGATSPGTAMQGRQDQR